jgi:hypothetical protein
VELDDIGLSPFTGVDFLDFFELSSRVAAE